MEMGSHVNEIVYMLTFERANSNNNEPVGGTLETELSTCSCSLLSLYRFLSFSLSLFLLSAVAVFEIGNFKSPIGNG